MNEKISLAGDLGSGKSTVSAILKERLSAETYSTGALVRDIARAHGMTVGELNIYMETHPEIDREIDDGLCHLSDDARRLIIDSRMAWHFTKGTFRVYLSTDLETSAVRILNAGRAEEHTNSLAETMRETFARRQSEKKRYMEQYGVDIKDFGNYDLVIDTTLATPADIADAVCENFERWRGGDFRPTVLLCPGRILCPDGMPDDLAVSECVRDIRKGNIPDVSVAEKDGNIYLIDGYAAVAAYYAEHRTFLPARIVRCDIPDGHFIRLDRRLSC